MLTYKEFEVLRALLSAKDIPQEGTIEEQVIANLHYQVFKNPSEVSTMVESLKEKGYYEDGKITASAMVEIGSCKVRNAVILAAGGSDISSKSVYSMPKGLYIKNGETLIERQIRQLKEAGIFDITVVVGYKQEMYYFLEEKCGVKLVVCPDLKKNNIYSLYMAIDELDNTYICNCDNYYLHNPFSKYEYNAYHAVLYKDDARNELVVDTNHSGRITRVFSGVKSGLCIYGHAYVDAKFSRTFRAFMKKEIEDFRINKLFWEEFMARHFDDLDMFIRKYSVDFLYEFDSIQEIQNIDSLFLDNVSDRVNRHICESLHCTASDISEIEVLQKGLSNVLFTFVVKGEKYIFRYPGESTSAFIYRKNEVCAQQLGYKSGVDGTYVYIDETGVKISKFREGIKDLSDIYYKDCRFMCRISAMIRKFHDESKGMTDNKEYEYNPIKEAAQLMKNASQMKGGLFEIFRKDIDDITRLYNYCERDGIAKCMCHNDLNGDNCLLTDSTLDIIDWEFAGWNDPAYDFGRVIGNYDFDDPDIDSILAAYFGRPATSLERLHWIAYVGIHNWYYVNWALYKESINESSRDWMLFCYHKTKAVLKYALPKYEDIYGK